MNEIYHFIIEPEKESSGKSFKVMKELGILSSGQQLNIIENYSISSDYIGLDQLRISSISVVLTNGGTNDGKY